MGKLNKFIKNAKSLINVYQGELIVLTLLILSLFQILNFIIIGALGGMLIGDIIINKDIWKKY
jgi:hypothetical protein